MPEPNTYLKTVPTARSPSSGVVTTNSYLNERLQSTQNAATGLITYAYDEFDRSVGYDYTEGSLTKTIRNTLDANGNILSVTQTAGNDSRTGSYLYDALNRKTQETTPEGQTVTYTYDAQGNITAVSGNVYPQEYTYDLQGRITGITTHRNQSATEVTTFTYDNRGRMRSRIYPDNATEQFAYRGDGNIDFVTNARGQVIGCSYDTMNRLTAIQGSGIYWEFAYDYRNLLIRACDGTYYHNFGYDQYGNLICENFSDVPNTEIAYFYDGYKRFAGYSFDGRQVNYSYSTATGVLDSVGSGSWRFTYNRIPGSGSLAQTVARRNGRIVQTVSRDYNLLGDLTNIGGYGYTVNLDGRREAATQTDGKTWAYTYDTLNQVVAGVLSDGNTPVSSHTYAYDLIGNRTTSSDNGIVKAYTANDLNQYTEVNSVEFEYDADGNLLSDGQFIYEYDAQNQLVSVSTETEKQVFVYDFMGRRIATESYFKSGSSWIQTTRRRYVYQGWNVIAEFVNGARSKTYVWGEDLSGELQGAGGVGGLLLEQNACGDYLPVYDGNGNIIAYKNDEGNVVSTYAYDPFGNVITHAGMDFTYKFSTKPQDELSGMYYYGYRFYQPELGRWINRDPIRESGNNNYVLVSNNPALRYDLLGMMNVSQLLRWNITGAPGKKELTKMLCILQKLGVSKDESLSDTYFMLQNIIANGSILYGKGLIGTGEAVSIYGQPSMILDEKKAKDERDLLGSMMHEARHHVGYVFDLLGHGVTYDVEDRVLNLINDAKIDITYYACCANKRTFYKYFSRYSTIATECSGTVFAPCGGGMLLGKSKVKFTTKSKEYFECECKK